MKKIEIMSYSTYNIVESIRLSIFLSICDKQTDKFYVNNLLFNLLFIYIYILKNSFQ